MERASHSAKQPRQLGGEIPTPEAKNEEQDIMIMGRQIADWRFPEFRLSVVAGGARINLGNFLDVIAE